MVEAMVSSVVVQLMMCPHFIVTDLFWGQLNSTCSLSDGQNNPYLIRGWSCQPLNEI